MTDILVVGAGFAGAVYARVLAENGYRVVVIDRRDHIAGNCFDALDDAGIRVHRYGPHLFHTSNVRVVEWLSRFTEWLPYEHRVKARLPDGRLVPMPINRYTVNALFGTSAKTPEEVAVELAARAIPCEDPANAEQFLFSRLGRELTDLFYRPYTRKMWEMDLSETSADVVRRLQIRTDGEDRYFPGDSFQALPAEGYTALFARILDHPGIAVRLNTHFSDELAAPFAACFNSMPIDEYFGFDLGELPYRSIRFHTTHQPRPEPGHPATINYTDAGPFTRETWWHVLPGHDTAQGALVTRTVEEPCDYRDNAHERFYPVKAADGRHEALYARYAARQARHPGMQFIGRCGTYQYLDMHQVTNQSLAGAEKWLKSRQGRSRQASLAGAD
jgi:UDP-galactopyranose mutase